MIKDDRQRFTLRLPANLLEMIGAEANRIGVPINALILQILWEWVKNNKPE